jgi:hypothetical protein
MTFVFFPQSPGSEQHIDGNLHCMRRSAADGKLLKCVPKIYLPTPRFGSDCKAVPALS